ncbi:MAG: TonB-dependent receptor [Bacteroidota bacterium]
MEQFRELTTKEKALKINLNSAWYGSFAEIGAGQRTADHFFKAGGASGTIAKTMSAYDMKFSDAIYGKAKRYVSKDRMLTMLDHEYRLLEERLTDQAHEKCFFALANTVEVINYRKTNQGHGWIGIKVQLSPHTPPNDIILHVVLKDNEQIWQQEVIGIMGVNLIYACYHFPHDTDTFLRTLMEGLSSDRIEVDSLRMSGPNFEWVDNRLLALKLVKTGMTNGAMFGPNGEVLHPADALYKKNVLVFRGRFRPPTHVNMDMIHSGMKQFLEEEGVKEKDLLPLAELTLKNLTDEGIIDEKDFLDRVDILGSLGMTVMVSNFQEYYRLVSHLAKFTRKRKIGMVLGVYNLEMIFDESYYKDLRGGILEAFGILFGVDVKFYVYPALIEYAEELYSSQNFQLPRKEMFHLFQFLVDTNKIEDIEGVDPDLLHITSDQVLAMIREGKSGWESMVPDAVAQAVKTKGLFGYPLNEKVNS